MQDELLEYGSAKASVMEISHRGADFMALAQKSEQDLRDLMNIPDNYKVLFMQGGASSQFSMVPTITIVKPAIPIFFCAPA
jgi:phosphoserine aminotransferase